MSGGDLGCAGGAVLEMESFLHVGPMDESVYYALRGGDILKIV
jgi:hypothetical protein